MKRTAEESAARDAPAAVKRPRGRPPLGAVLTNDGQYELPPEAVEAAAARLLQHREACRRRYAATRQGLRLAKPELFKKKGNDRLDEFCRGAPADLG